MPQLNLGDFAPQLVWLAICFIGLYIIMAKAALPRIGSVLEQRRDKIASDLDQAERLKADTETALADYQSALAEARARAHAIAEETRIKLKSETDAQARELEDQLGEKTADAEARIAIAKNAAMAQVRAVAADAASAIVKELIDKSVSKTKAQNAVGTAARV